MAPTRRSQAHALSRKRARGGIQIFVKTPASETITLDDLDFDESIYNIKTKIQDEVGFPHDTQQLGFGRCVSMKNHTTLRGHGVKSGDTLRLLLVDMQIFVDLRTGKRIELICGANDTIDDVKTMIRVSEGMPDDQQLELRFEFAGKQLKNRRPLSHYDINAQEVLTCFWW